MPVQRRARWEASGRAARRWPTPSVRLPRASRRGRAWLRPRSCREPDGRTASARRRDPRWHRRRRCRARRRQRGRCRARSPERPPRGRHRSSGRRTGRRARRCRRLSISRSVGSKSVGVCVRVGHPWKPRPARATDREARWTHRRQATRGLAAGAKRHRRVSRARPLAFGRRVTPR